MKNLALEAPAVTLADFFPITSQTSDEDKKFLIGAIRAVWEHAGDFNYVEIGSFLGGSLTPCLMEQACKLVLSIDERGRQQPDERGAFFDYAGITTQTMLDKLRSVGISTDKLRTFDGSIDNLPEQQDRFDIAFIDGEHTDEAAFRDCLCLLPLMKPDCIIMFHDSVLIYKAIQMLQMMIKKNGLAAAFFKRVNSDMSAILLGAYSSMRMEERLGEKEDEKNFYINSEKSLLSLKLQYRVAFNLQYEINDPPVLKAY